jgi:hypothetical protein
MKYLLSVMLLISSGAQANSNQELNSNRVDVNDPNAEFLVYTGSSGKVNGLKVYEFDKVERNYKNSIEHCELRGLRFLTEVEALDLGIELELDKSKLKKWLGGEEQIFIWASSSSNLNKAWDFFVDGNISIGNLAGNSSNFNGGDTAINVRCVAI